MKYKFVNKAKNLSPEDIKAHMNFDTVVKGASIWAGFKLGSVLLKFGSKITTAAVAGTSTVVVTTAVVVATNTDWLQPKKADRSVQPTELNEVQEELPEDQEEVLKILPEETQQVEAEKKAELEKEEEVESIAPVKPTPKPVKPDPAKDIESNNVAIKARPLPDLSAFHDFVYDELKYPVGVGDTTEGYVLVHFKINKEGFAEDFKINKSLGEPFDREAIRVLKKFQNWKPGSFNGDAVDNFFTFKVTFRVK